MYVERENKKKILSFTCGRHRLFDAFLMPKALVLLFFFSFSMSHSLTSDSNIRLFSVCRVNSLYD